MLKHVIFIGGYPANDETLKKEGHELLSYLLKIC